MMVDTSKYRISQYGILTFTLLLGFVFSTLTSCGSKKKTTEINKSVYKENKDLSVFTQKNTLSVITFTKDATEMIIEPDVPNNPLIIGKDTIIGAKSVKYRKVKSDSTAQVTEQVTAQVRDKGRIYSSKKQKNQYKEKKVQILWWQWVILIVGFLIGAAILYFKATGKRIKFWQ